MRRRVLVTGASGQLAGAIASVFGRDSDVTALTRQELDITDDGAANAAVAAHRPDVLRGAGGGHFDSHGGLLAGSGRSRCGAPRRAMRPDV